MLILQLNKATFKKTSEWWTNAWIWLANYIFWAKLKVRFFCSSKVWIKEEGKEKRLYYNNIFYHYIQHPFILLYHYSLQHNSYMTHEFIIFFWSNNFIFKQNLYRWYMNQQRILLHIYLFYFVLRSPDLENIWVYALATYNFRPNKLNRFKKLESDVIYVSKTLKSSQMCKLIPLEEKVSHQIEY